MLFITKKIGSTEYKLRLNAKNAVQLERKLGKHPLSVLTNMNGGQFPGVEDVVMVMHASLQAYHHEVTEDKAYEIYDEFIEDGNSIEDTINMLVEIYQTAGFLPKEIEGEEVKEEKKQ